MERAALNRAAPLQSQNSVKFCQTGCYDSAHIEHLSVYNLALSLFFAEGVRLALIKRKSRSGSV